MKIDTRRWRLICKVRQSLQFKLLLPLLIVGVLLAVLTAGLSLRSMNARAQARLFQSAVQLGRVVNHAVETVRSHTELERFVAVIGAEREVRHIVIVGGEPAHVIATTRAAWHGRLLHEILVDFPGAQGLTTLLRSGAANCAALDGEHAVRCVLPLERTDQKFPAQGGAILIELDARQSEQAMRRGIVSQVVLMLATVLVICAIAWALLHFHVLRPVRSMTRATERRQRGETAARSSVKSEDELGRLADKLNGANDIVDRTLNDLTLQKREVETLGVELQVRMRESSCLAQVSALCQRSTLHEDELLDAIVRMLPGAWRYPELAAARLTLEHKRFESPGFEPTAMMQSATIQVFGVSLGRVDVVYLSPPPKAVQAPFLREERELIDAIAAAIGETVQRRRGESDLARSNGLLEGIGQAQSQFIAGKHPREVFDELLEISLEVTQSEYGFIGEVLRTPEGQPYLRTYAISNIAWDEATGALYEQQLSSGMEFFNLKSLFGTVMTSEALMIANRPATDPRRSGLPQGHPPLNAFMGIPIHAGGELVGMVGVANRIEGYEPAQARFLEPLLVTCGNLILAHRNEVRRAEAESELRRHRDHLNELVREQTTDLMASKEEAERANLAKSEFLANMSHELRTPMHAVMSFAQLGQDRAATQEREKLGQYFAQVLKGAQRLMGLLNDLLDLSKMEAGKMRLDLESRDLAELARDAIAGASALAQSRRIEVILEERGEPVSVQCDPLRILQVINNLLSNALKFSRGGSVIRVRVSASTSACNEGSREASEVESLAQGREDNRTESGAAYGSSEEAGTQRRWGMIEVIDQGIGIPEQELDTIFQKFVQSSKTKSGAGGTGLGLAICREIAAVHGGEIAARNNVSGGATFTLTLPALNAAALPGGADTVTEGETPA